MPAHSFNHWTHNRLWVVPFFLSFFFLSFTTANDEVIVYFPTGGCLGDASLSAERWRNLQFLLLEWKVEAKVWSHVGLCVCFTDVHFSWHAQKPHVSSTSLESVTLMPWAPCVSGLWHHQSLCFVEACLLMKHPDDEAWASYLLGGFSMSRICSMSKSCFDLNAHSDSMLNSRTIFIAIVITFIACLHTCTVLLYVTLMMYSMMTLP